MKVKVVIERGSDGCYSAYMDEEGLDFGLYGMGDTPASAVLDLRDAEAELRCCYCDINGRSMPELEYSIVQIAPNVLV
jgi:hypothetical protein